MSLLKILNYKNHSLSIKNRFVVYIGIAFMVFFFYANSLHNGYSLDDSFYVQSDNIINNFEDIKSIFTSNSFQDGDFNFAYRPITTLSFAIENTFFGNNPTLSHLISILLYILSSCLLFRLLTFIFDTKKVIFSVAAAFLFIIMPVHTEIVDNIKCRDELLAVAFGLLATTLWVKYYSKNIIYLLLSILMLVLSILSKKTGLIFLGIIPICILFKDRKNWKTTLITSLLMILPAILFRLSKKLINVEETVRSYSIIENPLYSKDIYVNKFTISMESFWFYIKQMTFPTKLVSYYGYDTIPFQDITFHSILAFFILILLVALAIYGLKNRTPYSFGIIILIGGILPFLNLFIPMVGIVAERTATIPSIGAAILIVSASELLYERLKSRKVKLIKLIMLIPIISITGIYYFKIQERNREWENKTILFAKDALKEPRSASLHALIGGNYLNIMPSIKGDQNIHRLGLIAQKALKNSLEIVENKTVLTNLASINFRAFLNYTEAEKLYKRALEIDSNYIDATQHLAWLKLATKDSLEASLLFKKSILKAPHYIDAYMPLLIYLTNKKQFDEAIYWNEIGMSENPNVPIFTLNYVNIYYKKRDIENAYIWLNKAIVVYPHNITLKQMLEKIESVRAS